MMGFSACNKAGMKPVLLRPAAMGEGLTVLPMMGKGGKKGEVLGEARKQHSRFGS